MQSNRLVVKLNKDMEISYESGIQTVYLNSYLTKEFVVRPEFKLGADETMWITFYQDGATPLETIMLAERTTTKANSTKQVLGDDWELDRIEQSTQEIIEYYTQLPQAVLKNAGDWQFSLAIVVLYDNTTDSVAYDKGEHEFTEADTYELVQQADTVKQKKTMVQGKTSDIGGFTVQDSLANMPGGAPNDKSIADLYIDAIFSKQDAETAQEEAVKAKKAAETAAQMAEESATAAADIVAKATESITEEVTERVTETIKPSIDAETERATQAESELESAIDAERNRAINAEDNVRDEMNTRYSILSTSILTDRRKIEAIQGYIPSDTTEENPLTNKDFVNSSINNMAAFYIEYNAAGDAFPTRAALLNAKTFYNAKQPRVPTQNDYAFVLSDESQPKDSLGNYPTTRYSYQGGTYPDGQWGFQYIVNNTSLTQAQVNAINSGITKELVDEISEPSDSVPLMDGNASAGTSKAYARWDHTHPTDTTRASTAVATQVAKGLMSATDKTKLDGVEVGAQKNPSVYALSYNGTLDYNTASNLYDDDFALIWYTMQDGHATVLRKIEKAGDARSKIVNYFGFADASSFLALSISINTRTETVNIETKTIPFGDGDASHYRHSIRIYSRDIGINVMFDIFDQNEEAITLNTLYDRMPKGLMPAGGYCSYTTGILGYSILSVNKADNNVITFQAFKQSSYSNGVATLNLSDISSDMLTDNVQEV